MGRWFFFFFILYVLTYFFPRQTTKKFKQNYIQTLNFRNYYLHNVESQWRSIAGNIYIFGVENEDKKLRIENKTKFLRGNEIRDEFLWLKIKFKTKFYIDLRIHQKVKTKFLTKMKFLRSKIKSVTKI